MASAQPGKRKPSPTPVTTTSSTGPTNLRAHVGTEYASRLLHSADSEERIRGIQRAAAIGSQESVALLVQAIESIASVRADSRSLLEMARALAKFADQDRARGGLLLVVNAGSSSVTPRITTRTGDGLALDEGDPVARAELARQVAAIALARSGVDRALETLYGAARTGGSGQNAAILALTMYPPKDPGFFGTAGMALPVALIKMLGQLGDLRALDVLHAAAKSTDVTIRGAALIALAELGDERAIGLARTAIAETDARLRASAGEVFVILNAPERFKATTALISDDATVAIGVRLAERVFHVEVTKLLAARANEHPDRDIRIGAIRALGRSPDPNAAKALVAPQILGDNALAYLAGLALARSPAPNAGSFIAGLAAGNKRTLGVRAYVVHALVRGERIDSVDSVAEQLVASRNPQERALGVFTRLALGAASATSFLEDADPRVRRAAAMGALAKPARDVDAALLARLRKEPDAITRQVLAIGLRTGDPESAVTTTMLIDRAESGGADAALSAFALARRADEPLARKVGQLLGSKDPVLRAHTARGLGDSSLPDASGRLSEAYAYETDVDVRRAIIGALAMRTKDASAPARKQTLELASSLDPDGAVRQLARRALAGSSAPLAPSIVSETAWLRLALENGNAPGEPFAGSLVAADGFALPLVFDEEGFALVPNLPPGEARLVLAPRLPAYKPGTP